MRFFTISSSRAKIVSQNHPQSRHAWKSRHAKDVGGNLNAVCWNLGTQTKWPAEDRPCFSGPMNLTTSKILSLCGGNQRTMTQVHGEGCLALRVGGLREKKEKEMGVKQMALPVNASTDRASRNKWKSNHSTNKGSCLDLSVERSKLTLTKTCLALAANTACQIRCWG